MGWDIERKIHFIETRCMYFLGFGLVLSVLFNMPGSLIYNTTFSTFFIPIVIFNGIETSCEHLEEIEIRFPVFDFQFSLIRLMARLLGNSKSIVQIDADKKEKAIC